MIFIYANVLSIFPEIYINGNKGMHYYLDLILAMYTYAYCNKLIVNRNTKDILNTILIRIPNSWNDWYCVSFDKFMYNLNQMLIHNEEVPFIIEHITRSDYSSHKYNLSINDNYYKHLEKSFVFPDLNTIIVHCIENSYKAKTSESYYSHFLKRIDFDIPINNPYIICDEPKIIKSKVEPIEDPTTTEQLKVMTTRVDTLSSMLKYIYDKSNTSSEEELKKSIHDIYSIMFSSVESEPTSKRPRLEQDVPLYD